MFKYILFLILLLLSLLQPITTTHAAEEDEQQAQLLAMENERIKAMHELLRTDTTPPSAPPIAPLHEEVRCGNPGQRTITLRTSNELHAALAAARPGDTLLLAPGVYRGNFVAAAQGRAAAPITLCGPRSAVLDGGSPKKGYVLHLTGSHWHIAGVTVRNGLKGIMADNANNNLLYGLEIAQIGDEGIHFRSFSGGNTIQHSWIHDVGQLNAEYGEGIYIGSAHTNWKRYSNGKPDASNGNQIIGNLIGPRTSAESIDIKEGTSEGTISGNTFISEGMRAADSWVDLKGNGYRVEHNRGIYPAKGGFKVAIEVHEVLKGWGRDNQVTGTQQQAVSAPPREPFRATYAGNGQVSIVLPPRELAYNLSEVIARFPDSLLRVAPGVILVREHLFVGQNGRLEIDLRDAQTIRLLSEQSGFTSLVGFRSELVINGSKEQSLLITSWDQANNGVDSVLEDGRAYVLMRGGRMDLTRVTLSDLGFGLGQTSGVAWKGYGDEISQGDVRYSRFERNQFGAYTYEAEGMHWIKNSFANNLGYGFDPHDFSNHFVVEENIAFGNGSHGIIFSRGCSNNHIIGNIVFNNRGHGIFIDDGKVLKNDQPRYAKPVPSNHNLIAHNSVWGNEVGIAFEGGSYNDVTENQLINNATGIRLNDQVSENTFTANTIRNSEGIAIHVFAGSERNTISNNTIEGGKGGILMNDAAGNIIADNTISAINGRGIVISGPAQATQINNNHIAGIGSAPIDSSAAIEYEPAQTSTNEISGWHYGKPLTLTEAVTLFLQRHPAIVLWMVIFGVPLGMWLPTRLRRRGGVLVRIERQNGG
jgi:parallel beta-helix repeat protein